MTKLSIELAHAHAPHDAMRCAQAMVARVDPGGVIAV